MDSVILRRKILACLLGGMLVIAFLFSLFACANSASPAQTSTSSAQASTSNVPTTTTAWVANGIIDADEYTHSATFDNGNFQIFWKVAGQYLNMGLKAKTSGWVAIGFDSTSNQKNIDYVFGWVSGGKTSVADGFSADRHEQHQTDVSIGGREDVTEFGGQESDSFTIIEFKRALVTGDAFDASLKPGDASIIWAFGASDNISTMHTGSGSGLITM